MKRARKKIAGNSLKTGKLANGFYQRKKFLVTIKKIEEE